MASFLCFCFLIWVRWIIWARRGLPRGKYGVRAGVSTSGMGQPEQQRIQVTRGVSGMYVQERGRPPGFLNRELASHFSYYL